MKVIPKVFIVCLLFISCTGHSQKNVVDQNEIDENLRKMNRDIVEKESKEVDEFISRHSFETTMTGTGLRYQIYFHGKGRKASLRDDVEINYKVYLLDGTLCYSTDSSGPVKIHLGIGEQVRGLEEGIMLMVPGDRAHLVIPAHLAYGMTGDKLKIPPASALYFDVELIQIIK
jgi:FKBP-type peptidyl-prolyl cis-trans isomerase